MNNLSKKARIALASGGAGLLALAVALGIWQPWNKKEPEEEQKEPPQQQQEVKPPKEEQGPSLTVGGEKIPCAIYEGEGWSIYVPEGWTVDDSEAKDGIWKMYPDAGDKGAYLEVGHGHEAVYAGSFVGAYPVDLSDTERYLVRVFHAGAAGEPDWDVTCHMPREEWDSLQKLMTAMVRTLTVGEEKPFSGLSPVASEPQWQSIDGLTILWMDKDGYVVDDEAKKFVEEEMLDWTDGTKSQLTGKYRLANLHWAGSYTCLPGREYVDVFQFGVRYEVAPGQEEERRAALAESGWEDLLEDGWQARSRYPMNVVIFHDGSAVEEVRVFQSNLDNPGGSAYLSSLLQDDPDSAVELTEKELKQWEAYFNAGENNGLLRFDYSGLDGEQLGAHLGVLFYDLGDPEDKLSREELAALEKAGAALDLDTNRLTRAFVLDYLDKKYGMDGKYAEELLETHGEQLGVYLEKFNAWYMCHGDTAMQNYTFDRGELYPAGGGYVRLHYTAPYLWGEDADSGSFDVPMTVTLYARPDGEWRLASNLPRD